MGRPLAVEPDQFQVNTWIDFSIGKFVGWGDSSLVIKEKFNMVVRYSSHKGNSLILFLLFFSTIFLVKTLPCLGFNRTNVSVTYVLGNVRLIISILEIKAL